MHYGDKYHRENQVLEIVVYKHGIGGRPVKTKKDGTLDKRCVHYKVSSVQKCHLWSPRMLARLFEDPHKYVNKKLSSEKFEEWYFLKLKTDGYTRIQVISVENVTRSVREWLRMH